jgi:hypothetical protein
MHETFVSSSRVMEATRNNRHAAWYRIAALTTLELRKVPISTAPRLFDSNFDYQYYAGRVVIPPSTR